MSLQKGLVPSSALPGAELWVLLFPCPLQPQITSKGGVLRLKPSGQTSSDSQDQNWEEHATPSTSSHRPGGALRLRYAQGSQPRLLTCAGLRRYTRQTRSLRVPAPPQSSRAPSGGVWPAVGESSSDDGTEPPGAQVQEPCPPLPLTMRKAE